MIAAIVPLIFSRGSMAGMQTQAGRADSHHPAFVAGPGLRVGDCW
jgi:hypothetical protein